ncbi:thioredoxin [Geochorda subterranea]|uniref:Thioredoxin n=1 Tax=Geochorda subterranea TaxID=3109564 RepID=A0ABZ1BPT9_9FIRM|nr:thioredoxin [Limnochorda sp. LNt]WRP14122.1 thioredoxin [Limnochorda sp. LNt]
MASEHVHTFTQANWDQEVLGSDTPVLVDFWAAWCGPCLRMAPIVDAIAEEYAGRLKVGKLNVDEHPDLATRYGIMSIPTLVLFKAGEPVEFIVGLQPRSSLVRRIETVLDGASA